jgi:hypothetical protein
MLRFLDLLEVYLCAVDENTIDVDIVLFEKVGQFKIDQDPFGADHPVTLGVVDGNTVQLQAVEPEHAEAFDAGWKTGGFGKIFQVPADQVILHGWHLQHQKSRNDQKGDCRNGVSQYFSNSIFDNLPVH